MTASPPESVTRGFLFADLRGYTDFVERHGAGAAASLLTRYRELARAAIARFGGAEIKTEGDSFYVVFTSVSSAVRCGLALTADAAAATEEQPDAPIRVGVGIHAGETVELDDAYVGSAVNIAARLCSQAGAGEVVVSETVRALTRGVLPVKFKSRGRRSLKGIAEPLELFAVTETADAAEAWEADAGRRSRPRTRWIVGGAAALVGAAILGVGAWAVLRGPATLPAGTWTIALEAPLTGYFSDLGVAMRNAAQLAIDDVNESGALEGVELVLEAYDSTVEGEDLPDPERGAQNMTAMVEDPRTIAVIGPVNSEIAVEQIPIANEAGLLMCSPSTTRPQLTKPDFGSLELRDAYPERINFTRLSPSDDVQTRALADFATHDVGADTALVVDDGDPNLPYADMVAAEFERLGGNAFREVLDPDQPAVVADWLAREPAPDVVIFIGGTMFGAPELRRAMVDAGSAAMPLLATDFIFDGSGEVEESYIAQVGAEDAAGTSISSAAIGTPTTSFVNAFRAAYGESPEAYTPAAHACAEVIIDSLMALAETGPSEEGLREALRAHAVDTTHRYETALGTVGFDANGDSIQQFVTFYRVDPEEADGAGDWVPIKQQDFGAPQ